MFKLIIILIGLGIVLASIKLLRRRTNTLPDVSDDIFIYKFNADFPGFSRESVLQERKNIARQLDIPCEKLDPTCTFDDLSRYLNFLGSYDLAIGDLESSMSELFERLGVKRPYKSPSTIGELIYEIVKAKTAVTFPRL